MTFQPTSAEEQFVQILINEGIISVSEWNIVKSIHQVQGGRILEILLGLCPISEELLYKAVAKELNLPFWHEHELLQIQLSFGILKQFPSIIALEYNFLPIKIVEDNGVRTLHLVFSNPLDKITLDLIKNYAGVDKLQVSIATPTAIVRAIQVHYRNQKPSDKDGRLSISQEVEQALAPLLEAKEKVEEDNAGSTQSMQGIAPPQFEMRECPVCGHLQPIDIKVCTNCNSPTDLEKADPLIGKKVSRFKLIRKLGEGGMGLVYEAIDESTGLPAAVKLLRTQLTTNDRVVKRFHREAKAQQRLKHKNIVYVYDFGFEEGVGFFIAMEFLEGMSLEEILEKRPEEISIKFIADVMKQVCDAMSYAHASGIYHRDIKPDNIFLQKHSEKTATEKPSVKLLDFGVARMVSEEDERLTRTGMTIGTPRYMAPEQASEGSADHRSDIYSLGVILFELLTGRPPFEGSSAYQIMLRHVYADPPTIDKIRPDLPYPQSLVDFVKRTMAKNPDERPFSMDMFWSELSKTLREFARIYPSDRPLHKAGQIAAHRQKFEDIGEDETSEPPVVVGKIVDKTAPPSSDFAPTPPDPNNLNRYSQYNDYQSKDIKPTSESKKWDFDPTPEDPFPSQVIDSKHLETQEGPNINDVLLDDLFPINEENISKYSEKVDISFYNNSHGSSDKIPNSPIPKYSYPDLQIEIEQHHSKNELPAYRSKSELPAYRQNNREVKSPPTADTHPLPKVGHSKKREPTPRDITPLQISSSKLNTPPQKEKKYSTKREASFSSSGKLQTQKPPPPHHSIERDKRSVGEKSFSTYSTQQSLEKSGSFKTSEKNFSTYSTQQSLEKSGSFREGRGKTGFGYNTLSIKKNQQKKTKKPSIQPRALKSKGPKKTVFYLTIITLTALSLIAGTAFWLFFQK